MAYSAVRFHSGLAEEKFGELKSEVEQMAREVSDEAGLVPDVLERVEVMREVRRRIVAPFARKADVVRAVHESKPFAARPLRDAKRFVRHMMIVGEMRETSNRVLSDIRRVLGEDDVDANVNDGHDDDGDGDDNGMNDRRDGDEVLVCVDTRRAVKEVFEPLLDFEQLRNSIDHKHGGVFDAEHLRNVEPIRNVIDQTRSLRDITERALEMEGVWVPLDRRPYRQRGVDTPSASTACSTARRTRFFVPALIQQSISHQHDGTSPSAYLKDFGVCFGRRLVVANKGQMFPPSFMSQTLCALIRRMFPRTGAATSQPSGNNGGGKWTIDQVCCDGMLAQWVSGSRATVRVRVMQRGGIPPNDDVKQGAAVCSDALDVHFGVIANGEHRLLEAGRRDSAFDGGDCRSVGHMLCVA